MTKIIAHSILIRAKAMLMPIIWVMFVIRVRVIPMPIAMTGMGEKKTRMIATGMAFWMMEMVPVRPGTILAKMG